MRKRVASAAFVLVLGFKSVAISQPTFIDSEKRLKEADHLAWLTNWYDALPLYADVERAATKAGHRRDALYAKFGRLRSEMQTLTLPGISEQIANDLATSLAKNDP